MADPLSDDSSAASSGDELLDMVVPFSQQSASTSPAKSRQSSDVEASPGSGDKKKSTGEATTPSKKRKHEEVAVEDMDEGEIEERARTKAERAISSHDRFGAPDKLRWLEKSKKKGGGKAVKLIYPVRIVPPDEIMGMDALGELKEGQFAVRDIKYPNVGELSRASERMLPPYYGKGEDRGRWCPTQMERYLKQLKKTRKTSALDLKTEESFLHCVLQKSLEEGEAEKKLAEVDEAVPDEKPAACEEVKCPDENSEDDEDDFEEAGRSTRSRVSLKETTERLRPGDAIEFYEPTRTAGDERALRTAIILSVDPNGSRVLTLDDPMLHLPRDHKVKRIKRFNRGKLLDNPGGQYRSIDRYDMRKEGDPDALRKQLGKLTGNVRGAIERAKEKAAAKMEEEGVMSAALARDMMR